MMNIEHGEGNKARLNIQYQPPQGFCTELSLILSSWLSAPLIAKTYVICLLAARKHVLFGISSKVGILP